MVSVVLNGLFWMPSILFPARAVVEGETTSRNPKPVTVAAPASAALARNLRRLRYKLLGVISEERMSSAFLISMRTPMIRGQIRLASIFHQIGRSRGEKVARPWFRSLRSEV